MSNLDRLIIGVVIVSILAIIGVMAYESPGTFIAILAVGVIGWFAGFVFDKITDRFFK